METVRRKAGGSLSTILITGAAGRIGSEMRSRMARPGRTLRLLDIEPLEAGPGEEAVRASVTDLAALTDACQGADAVIHLGGRSGEAPWDRILETNIDGTYKAYEAARRAGVRNRPRSRRATTVSFACTT